MKSTVTIPVRIFHIMRDNAKQRLEDVETGIEEGIYDDDNDNARLLAELKEAVNTPPEPAPHIKLHALSLPEKYPCTTFKNFEVHPCKEVDGHVHQIDTGSGPGYKIGEDGQTHPVPEAEKETPDFWSVYVHYTPSGGNQMFGGLDCIADCVTEKEAEDLKAFLEQIVKHYHPL